MSSHLTAKLFAAVEARCTLGEGPVWGVQDQVLWWVDIKGKGLWRYHWPSGRSECQVLPEVVGMVRLCRDGGLVLAQADRLVYRDVGGELHPLFKLGNPEARFNDGACSPDGRLFVGTMRYDGGEGGAAFYRIDAAGPTEMFSGVTISNGLAWSPDGGTLYYVDSATVRIDAFDYAATSGGLSNRRTVIRLHDYGWGVPDGMCRDDDGDLWVAVWGKGAGDVDGRVLWVSPAQGELRAVVKVPGAQCVTSCTFAGPERDVLIITTASGDDPQSGNGGRLFAVKPGVTGPPENCWQMPQSVEKGNDEA